MAQGFDVTQSLFGDIVTPQQRADASALAQANLGGLGMAQFQAARSQESARQQIPKLFGQQSEEDVVQDVRNKNLPILQSQGKMAYLDAIIADFSARGLGNKAFLAQQLKDQVAQKEAESQATIGFKEAQAEQMRAKASAKPKLLEIDAGDRIELRDPETYEVVKTIPKGLSPAQKAKAAGEAADQKPGFIGKTGAYRNQYNEVIPGAEMSKQRKGFQAGEDLLNKLNTIDYTDVVNAESMFDYASGGETKKAIGSKLDKKTVDAQTKIAAAQLLQQINSLPPGSASDADMRQAAKEFPGYGDATNLANWVNRTKQTLQNSLERQADQYGFSQRIKSSGNIGPKKAAKPQGAGTKEDPIKLD